ncbi:NERD domain-containing protein [Halomonas sp. 18H]|uniref:nuclease-related domain-containing protein n=1 Tax=Halomonas almeriensis TaxID=308163 RepID=UPI00223245A9|nr:MULTISPECIES: nuclease-related domain-containing protein [Halomonas]MCW4152984.1 NERD domain-containing protein [Halomonas sp. 18H]MDN3554333.1 nuclease-related domain-containing protein [Halomonas almeriensis]
MAWLEYLLPLIFLFPLAATAMVVLALRNLHDARVSSPFDAHRLREPGQSLRDRLDQAFTGLFLNGALGPIITLTPLVYGMGRMLFADQQNWLEWSLYGALSTVLVLVFCLRLIRDFQRIRRLKLGLACELAVGQELSRLIRPEAHPYFVFHDVSLDTSLDHVAVTPEGVFAIETRARTPAVLPSGEQSNVVVVEEDRLRFPGWKERQPLRETRQASRSLASWLEERTGQSVPVQGVLVMPGWQIEQADRAGDLLVVNGEGLADYLDQPPSNRQAARAFDDATHDAVIRVLRQHALSNPGKTA